LRQELRPSHTYLAQNCRRECDSRPFRGAAAIDKKGQFAHSLAMPAPPAIACDFAFERQRFAVGDRYVAGVDEVGRGPLAGPVLVAAVILDPQAIPDGLADSKTLSAERRVELAAAIRETALGLAIASASAAEVDYHNIRGATLRAMARAVAALSPRPDFALIDGRDIPAGLICPAAALIGGDGRSQSIAAASIVAKTIRDALMSAADRRYPGYGFTEHAGYATRAHREAILRLGLSALHRRSFRISDPF
jgi:ribonuclease HII